MRTLLRKRGPLALPQSRVISPCAMRNRTKRKPRCCSPARASDWRCSPTARTWRSALRPTSAPATSTRPKVRRTLPRIPSPTSERLAKVQSGQRPQQSRTGDRRVPDSEDEIHGYVWRDGTMTDVGTLGGDFSLATSLNNNGAAVGLFSEGSGGEGFAHSYGATAKWFPSFRERICQRRDRNQRLRRDCRDFGRRAGTDLGLYEQRR